MRSPCSMKNALLLQLPDELWRALCQRATGTSCLFTNAICGPRHRCTVFGHALMEKLVQPYPAITARMPGASPTQRQPPMRRPPMLSLDQLVAPTACEKTFCAARPLHRCRFLGPAGLVGGQ
jgi:hypothetical protein